MIRALQLTTLNPAPAQTHAPVRACVVESTDPVLVVSKEHERATRYPHPNGSSTQMLTL
jgi:hypothetical protein